MLNFTNNLIILIIASLLGVNCILFNDTSQKSVVTYSFVPSQMNTLFALSLDLMVTNITADGVLFYVSNRPENDDFISLDMKKSNLRLKYKCGANSDIVTLPVVNQFEWCTAKVSIKTSDVSLSLNDKIQNRNHGCNSSITLKSPYYIGGVDNLTASEDIKNDTDEDITKTFIGCLRNFKPISQSIKPRTSDVNPCSCNKVDKGTYFAGAGYFKLYEHFSLEEDITIQIQIKPRRMSGLIMAVLREDKYFLINLHMVNGSIKFTAKNRKGPVSTTYTPTSPYYFLDNEFHTITALKRSYWITLKIDTEEEIESSGGIFSTTDILTKDLLYIGGYPPALAASKSIETSANFIGCIQHFKLNYEVVNLSSYIPFGDVMFNVCPTI